MCDEWMPTIRLSLSQRQFHQLPRNAAYKYEYLAGQTWLSPRPRHYHARLELRPMDAAPPPEIAAGMRVRPVAGADWGGLEDLFAATFGTVQPFGSLDEVTRRKAAHQALERTYSGGDGPWIEPASFALDDHGQLAGAILVTLLPAGDPCDSESYRWNETPPADCIARCLGTPHLTWIFVSPALAGRGLGTMLLSATVNVLLGMGYRELLSTFMVGNDSSTLWHWRNGFRLLAYPGSFRHMHERWRRRAVESKPNTEEK